MTKSNKLHVAAICKEVIPEYFGICSSKFTTRPQHHKLTEIYISVNVNVGIYT